MAPKPDITATNNVILEMSMQVRKVDSSMASHVGYDPVTSILEIRFKKTGEVWHYYKVPETVFLELLQGSIGKYFQANIKGQYWESLVR